MAADCWLHGRDATQRGTVTTVTTGSVASDGPVPVSVKVRSPNADTSDRSKDVTEPAGVRNDSAPPPPRLFPRLTIGLDVSGVTDRVGCCDHRLPLRNAAPSMTATAKTSPPQHRRPEPSGDLPARDQRDRLLTADEEKQLAYRIADGDIAARDRMVRANLRLVVNIARGYTGKGLPICRT